MKSPTDNSLALMPLPVPQVQDAEEWPYTSDVEPSVEAQKVGPRYIWLMVLAQFGVFVAFITPLAISLSIRLSEIAPGQEQYLGYILGAGAFCVMLWGPFLGVASDRTRTRIGRRRPFIIAGMLIGVLSLFVMASAPNVLILGVGWVLAQLGWGQALNALQISTADRLPESQRGKVAGLVGFATQIAPVLGVSMAGAFVTNALLLFVIPGSVGVILSMLFVLLVHEEDSRNIDFGPRLTTGALFRKFLFNPRQHRDYTLNWAGRFCFNFGLTLNTTFTAFFFASKLGVGVAEVAPTIAILSLFSIVATTLGAIGGGFLSDRLRRRRVFILVAGIIFGGGAVTMAVSTDITFLTVGSLLGSVGIGAFSAVDQALLLDVLPERNTDAGRFMSIIGFATSIPQAVGPLLAPLFLAIGVGVAGERNYTLLYIIAAAFTVAGGFVIMRIRSVR